MRCEVTPSGCNRVLCLYLYRDRFPNINWEKTTILWNNSISVFTRFPSFRQSIIITQLCYLINILSMQSASADIFAEVHNKNLSWLTDIFSSWLSYLNRVSKLAMYYAITYFSLDLTYWYFADSTTIGSLLCYPGICNRIDNYGLSLIC